jgi:hypothetical protein
MATINQETMEKVRSLQGKMTPEFIDYCNLNGVNLQDWYRWQLHLIWQRRKDNRPTQTKK